MLHVRMFTFNPVQENSYVVFNQHKQAIIIDPGCFGKSEEDALAAFINDEGLQPVQLINTHCHLDHVFGNRFVAERYGLELYIHPNEKQMLEFAPQSGQMYGLVFENYSGPLHFLNEGDKVKLGDDELELLLTPGHSPGSLCLYAKNDGFIIAGDVLFRESIGRTDLPGGNHQALLENIREKLLPLPASTIVYPGHGPTTTIGHEQLHNPFLHDHS